MGRDVFESTDKQYDQWPVDGCNSTEYCSPKQPCSDGVYFGYVVWRTNSNRNLHRKGKDGINDMRVNGLEFRNFGEKSRCGWCARD